MTQPHAFESRTDGKPVSDAREPGTQLPRALPPISRNEIIAAANRAARTIAPLWPLESFVAVNPLLGIANRPFADADNVVDRIWGARLVMPRSFYTQAIVDGRIRHEHLAKALEELEGTVDHGENAGSVMSQAFCDEPASHPTPTMAEIISDATSRELHDFVVERISFWASGYFDEGQSNWRSPWRNESPYDAWRGEAELDQTPEIMGIPEFRSIIRTLPDSVDELLHDVAKAFGLHGQTFEIYLQRLLATVAGWAGHARYRGWRQELAGNGDERVKHILAVRAAWELALAEAFEKEAGDAAETLRQRLATPLHPDVNRSHVINLILHTAFEIATREPLLGALASTADESGTPVMMRSERPSAQAVFCIDVRSERMRRHLERADDGVETFGFAGFFGMALEVAPIDGTAGGAQCPVLLEPQYLVRETRPGAAPEEVDALARRTRLGRRLAGAWNHFSGAAISSFAFVESLGLTYAWRLLADGLGRRRMARGELLAPSLEPGELGQRASGIPLSARIDLARGILSGMSLTGNFARVVALVGHGSTTANNPYATRYHCGACGGHTGEANALVAADVLNDPGVRKALAGEHIEIPDDTLFIAGLHDTTTDTVSLLMPGGLPVSHERDVRALEESLAIAGHAAREERARSFDIADTADVDTAIIERSLDWSEVRPEWGLAGCRAFIAAPRSRTRGLDLGGRSFLHSYDEAGDDNYEVLEQIMTAPLVVASWISLQYYASTVDNEVFGSGDKTLHNVVGGLGVLEGNGGDLRVGLPYQSLHDGERFVHEPVRLNAFIEASTSAISEILERHGSLRELVDNGWIQLFAIVEGGKSIKRYNGGYAWSDALPAGWNDQVSDRAAQQTA